MVVPGKGVDNKVVWAIVVAIGAPDGKSPAACRACVAGENAVSGAFRAGGDAGKVIGYQLRQFAGISPPVIRAIAEQRLCDLFQRGRTGTGFGLFLEKKKTC